MRPISITIYLHTSGKINEANLKTPNLFCPKDRGERKKKKKLHTFNFWPSFSPPFQDTSLQNIPRVTVVTAKQHSAIILFRPCTAPVCKNVLDFSLVFVH